MQWKTERGRPMIKGKPLRQQAALKSVLALTKKADLGRKQRQSRVLVSSVKRGRSSVRASALSATFTAIAILNVVETPAKV